VKILFGDGVEELFLALPRSVQIQAAGSINHLAQYPNMYPVRRRGVMKGYRYFVALGILFYYSVSSDEVRISAILPGRMRRA
jgi:plasmid stabilization system protein ParE